MISIDDLMKPVTAAETYERFLSNLETLEVPARSWRVGGSLRTILRVIATNYAELSAVVSAAIRAGFLETAEGGWLTLLARYVFGEERQAATQAAGVLHLVNSGGGVYSFSAGQMRALHSVSGKAYVNTAAFSLGAGGTVDVSIAAVEIGSGANAGPNEIQDLETVMLGVSVTNPAAVVGVDEEKDSDLRKRCRDKLGLLSNGGPRRAYSYAARVATRSDGRPTQVNRVVVSRSSSGGLVSLVLASADGAVIADDVAAVTASVETLARPDCVKVSVVSATVVPIARDLTVWAVGSEFQSAAIEAAVRAAVVTWVSSYPIGGFAKPPSEQGYFFAASLGGVVKAADASIYAVDGVGADVALGPGQVASLTITVVVRVVGES